MAGATTRGSAPACTSSSALRSATLPPPTTSAVAPAHVEKDRQVVHGAPQGFRIEAAPFIQGRSAAGTVTLPSAFW